MRKLLRTDFTRLVKTLLFYLTLGGVTAIFYLCLFFSSAGAGESRGVAVCNTMCSLAVLLVPLVVCGAYMLFVSNEFSGGAIRNKLIVGHRRTDVYLSWSVVGLVDGLIVAAVSVGSSAILIRLFADTTGLSAKKVAVAAGIALCMLISKMCQSILLSVVLPGAKGMLVNYLLTYALLMFFVIMQDTAPDSKIVDLLARCFPEGQVTKLNISKMPDRPWLTVLCGLGFAALCVILGIHVFRKKDLS